MLPETKFLDDLPEVEIFDGKLLSLMGGAIWH